MKSSDQQLNTHFDILRDERRRRVISLLNEYTPPLSAERLAHAIVADERENDETPSSEEAVVASLHHAHLPRMEEAGLLEYDAQHGTVTDWELRHAGWNASDQKQVKELLTRADIA